MFKKLLAFLAAMSVFAAFAAVDVNKASEAELDGIKGVGPVTTRLIVAERKKSEFKSWDDFIARVKGVGAKSATKFSAEGLTVGGASYSGPSATVTKTATEKTKSAAVATKDAVKETAKDAKAAVTPKATAAKPAASAVK
ncbi:competence protein ComEA [Polaromonas sp. CG_9.5]|uniref:ComEA family DNA-binding protein n=1 Tax=Polaromonas sp. CG_9.5 TaxID=3071705 RepID=UPI002DFA0923|nr:competence protein ComEA [Polaromonas sp. CG_9.5]